MSNNAAPASGDGCASIGEVRKMALPSKVLCSINGDAVHKPQISPKKVTTDYEPKSVSLWNFAVGILCTGMEKAKLPTILRGPASGLPRMRPLSRLLATS